MKFVSLMGTQVMAVLNPLMAVLEQGNAPEKVILLATRKSMDQAERLKQFLAPARIPTERFEVIPISDSLQKDREGRAAAHTLMPALLSDDMVFNLAGGMNFQIAACVLALAPKKCLFLYPESSGVHTFMMADGKILVRERLPLPAPVDVMSLQGISFEKAALPRKARLHPFLKEIFAQAKMPLPPGAEPGIRIHNVVFDLVWNSGNELKFIKVIHTDGKKAAKQLLKEVRDVISLARNRENFGELYHRDVAIFTNHPLIEERIKTEGGGKTLSMFYLKAVSAVRMQAKMKKRLGDFLNPPTPHDLSHEVITEETGNTKNDDSILYTSLGTNIMPSLNALWSHRPAEVCYVYTPGVPEVAKLRDTILAAKKCLPASRVSFFPVSIEGTEILDLPIPPEGKGLVNITPGTKGHTAFLTLWAGMHNVPIFSLNNGTGIYEQIPEGRAGQITAPPPVSYLKLVGIPVKDFGDSKGNLLQNRRQHEKILDFLRRTDQERGSIADFYRNRIDLANAGSEFLQGEKVRIWRQGEEDLLFSTKGDEWFEALTAFVMVECGAEDVQVRMRTRWSEKTEKHLREKYRATRHMTDIDVIARFKSDYYVISCKATEKEAPGKITAEADAFASIFGRFAIPLVCYLKYPGEPYNTNKGVFIFGYKTLCDTAAMSSLLKEAVSVRRKTGQGKDE